MSGLLKVMVCSYYPSEDNGAVKLKYSLPYTWVDRGKEIHTSKGPVRLAGMRRNTHTHF